MGSAASSSAQRPSTPPKASSAPHTTSGPTSSPDKNERSNTEGKVSSPSSTSKQVNKITIIFSDASRTSGAVEKIHMRVNFDEDSISDLVNRLHQARLEVCRDWASDLELHGLEISSSDISLYNDITGQELTSPDFSSRILSSLELTCNSTLRCCGYFSDIQAIARQCE